MTAVIGGRSLQEEETHRGNISVIMLMECTSKNVPIEEEQEQAASCWTEEPWNDGLFYFALRITVKLLTGHRLVPDWLSVDKFF